MKFNPPAVDNGRVYVGTRDGTVVAFGARAGAPSLHAASAEPSSAGLPTVCVFKDVTLEANGQKWRVSQAELRNEDGRPRVVWKAGGGERRMDLFSGEIYGNSN